MPKSRRDVVGKLFHEGVPWRQEQHVLCRHQLLRSDGDHTALARARRHPYESGWTFYPLLGVQEPLDHLHCADLMRPQPMAGHADPLQAKEGRGPSLRRSECSQVVLLADPRTVGCNDITRLPTRRP